MYKVDQDSPRSRQHPRSYSNHQPTLPQQTTSSPHRFHYNTYQPKRPPIMTTRTEPPVGSENAPMGDDVPTPAITAQETLRQDIEKQPAQESDDDKPHKKVSAFRSLGVLDRFLAVWILLAMIIGVLLGNFVEETGPALQKGKFVGVSIPIAIGLLVMIYPSSARCGTSYCTSSSPTVTSGARSASACLLTGSLHRSLW